MFFMAAELGTGSRGGDGGVSQRTGRDATKGGE